MNGARARPGLLQLQLSAKRAFYLMCATLISWGAEAMQIPRYTWRNVARPHVWRKSAVPRRRPTPRSTCCQVDAQCWAWAREKNTPRLIARYPDACNLLGSLPNDDLRQPRA